MKTIATAMLGVVLVGFAGLAPAPARAGCNEDIESLEARLSENPDHPQARKVASMIAKSKAALLDGKSKRCDAIIDSAKAAFDSGEDPGLGKDAGAGGGGCSDLIQSLEDRVSESPGNAQARKVTNMIAKSKGALAQNKRKKCRAIISKAAATFEEGEAASGGKRAAAGRGKAATAECLARIPDLEKRLADVPSISSRRSAVADAIANAKKFAAQGKKKRCENMVFRADKTLTDMSF